jgi:hypothetical protein
MKLPECHTREKLGTLNQLKILLYTLAAKYAPVFETFLGFIEPVMYPHGAELNLHGSSPRHVQPANSWKSKLISRTKEFCFGGNYKKWQFFLDYSRERPEDLVCCGLGQRRLLVFGEMKFFHVDARPRSESYHVFASGEWPHMSVSLGLYLAREYPGITVASVGQMKDIIEWDAQNSRDESAAMMD